MRPINKDLNSIPESLKPNTRHFFPKGKYPRRSDSTHRIRIKMLEKGAYDDSADSHYNGTDVKKALKKIYHDKCAYCEQKVERPDVEHYRPKRGNRVKIEKKGGKLKRVMIENDKPELLHDGYYWLSLSWDNLLLSCPTCNGKKSNKFKIRRNRVTTLLLSEAGNQWENIHNLSRQYDDIEEPLLLNPERSELENQLIFDKNGDVKSEKPEGKYTIETCDLKRTYLVDERRKIIDDFVKEVKSVCVEHIEVFDGGKRYKETERMRIEMMVLMRSFISKSRDMDNPFIGFRKQAIDWLDGIVADYVGGNYWSLILQKIKFDMGV